MTGQKFRKCIALCLLPWSCLSFAWSDAAGPGTASPGAGHVRKGLPGDIANGTDVRSNISGTRASDRPPLLPLQGCSGPPTPTPGAGTHAVKGAGTRCPWRDDASPDGRGGTARARVGLRGFAWSSRPQRLLWSGRDATRPNQG